MHIIPHTACHPNSHSLCAYAHPLFAAPADFGIISYSFSRIAATIEEDRPFALSSHIALLCFIPTLVFVMLLLAYRYIRHPVFSYQRDGPANVGRVPTRNDSGVGDTTTVEAEQTVAEATAKRLLPCILRVVLGLSAFDATAIAKGGDKVLPGALPARLREDGCKTVCVFHVYRFLWWYWQALKRNHALLAPFLAQYDPRRGHAHHSSILLARYG